MTSSDANKPAGGGNASEEGGSMLPTLLAGAGILIVAGLMIFWPDSSTQATKKAGSENAASRGGANDAVSNRGGVPAREADEAKGAPRKETRINPRLRPATEFGMSATPPPSGPPEFNDSDEELEYWRTQLSEAKRVLGMREKAIERLPQIKEQIMAGNDPEGGLEAFKRREEVIYENLGKQKDKVKELEEKVGALEEQAGL